MKAREIKKRLLKIYIKYSGSGSIIDMDTVRCVLSDVSKSPCYSLEIPNPFNILSRSSLRHMTDEEKEKTKGVYNQILSLHSEFEKFYSPLVCFSEKHEESVEKEISGGEKLVSVDKVLIGDELVCYVNYGKIFECPTIDMVLYTEKTRSEAEKIWALYHDLCCKLLGSREDEVKRLYRISTIARDQGGSYFLTDVSIQPTVSLTSPDFLDNYNTDLPEDKIREFLDLDRGGIVIFNGQPGCGKSTYIKRLIFKYPDINFVVLPQYFLNDQNGFRTFLLGRENSGEVFIIEDCEQLLVQRENNLASSSIIGDILNYTDGIYGDLTRTKFIFTFNTDLSNIDKAILRPGRLFLKYEFTPLYGENLEKVAEKLGYPLTQKDKERGVNLSELYSGCKSEDLQMGIKKKPKMGY